MLIWIWIITRLVVITPSSRPIVSLRRKIWAADIQLKTDLININSPRNLGVLPSNMDIICDNVYVNLGNSPKILGMLYIFLINL